MPDQFVLTPETGETPNILYMSFFSNLFS